MSNQRAAQMHQTAAGFAAADNQYRVIVDFFKRARTELAECGYEDAAYYFEQTEQYLVDGGKLTDSVTRILGL